MISDSYLVFYTCIAKGSVILAEFSTKEAGIESLALQCLERAPPYHSMFSHTVRNRTYSFLIGDPLTFFGIFDENMDRSEYVWFLHRLKGACDDLIRGGKAKSLENASPCCLQAQLDPIFAEIMGLELDLVFSPRSMEGEIRNPSLDSTTGKRSSRTPLLGTPLNYLKKKKKRMHSDTNGDASPALDRKGGEGSNGGTLSCIELKNGLLHGADHHRQKAKQIWRKHVWVVLIFDLFVCALLFGIWLWVCEGFQCIEG